MKPLFSDSFTVQSGGEDDTIADAASYHVAVVGIGYVGLSLAVLLAQHHSVIAVDTNPDRVAAVNELRATIRDEEIERFLSEAKDGKRVLHLTATENVAAAHQEFVGMQPGDVPVTCADSSALERDYGFTPRIPIQEGLRRFAAWYRTCYTEA